MSRPRSEERRRAILVSATHTVAEQGLGASTSSIAQGAGVSNGSLFTYFETKSALLNELYLELKTNMAAAVSHDLPLDAPVHSRFHHVWTRWVEWAQTHPDQRRALAHLAVCDDLTPETHRLATEEMGELAEILKEARDGGPMAGEPLGFVLTLVTALAESTIDAIVADPGSSASRSQAGFQAMWRVLADIGALVNS